MRSTGSCSSARAGPARVRMAAWQISLRELAAVMVADWLGRGLAT